MRDREAGFTLLEVLVALLLLGLVFGTVLVAFGTTGRGGLRLRREAEELQRRAYLLYLLRRQLEGLSRLRLEKREDGLYVGLITSTGERFRGLVQVRYRWDGRLLFYCENPHPLRDLLSCGRAREVPLGRFTEFEVRVFAGGRRIPEERPFGGRPEKVSVRLDGDETVIPVRVGWVLR